MSNVDPDEVVTASSDGVSVEKTADPEALRHHVRSFEHPRTLEILEIGDATDL
jgi:hypothetical protein